MRPATARQQAILDFVQQHLVDRGFPPTLREIGEALGLANVSAVRGHVAALERKGYIVKDPDKARSIRLVDAPSLLSRFKKRLHEVARTDEGVLHQVVYGLGLAIRDPRIRLTGAVKPRIEAGLRHRAAEHGWELVRTQVEADRVLMVIRAWPNHSPELVVARVRHSCEAVIRRERKGLLLTRHLWVKGYVVTTNPDQLDALMAHFLDEAKLRGEDVH